MDFFAVLISMITLFVIMGIGYFLQKHGTLDGNRVHLISHVLVNIAIPALTIMSMQMPNTLQEVGLADHTLLLAFAYYMLAFVASLVICRFLPSTGPETGVFRFMLVFPNVGFMGIPVAEAIFGPGSLFYVILFNLPFNLLAFTLGVWLLAQGQSKRPTLRILLTPGLVASFLGLILFFGGIHIPWPVDTVLDWTGKMTTPLAMLVVGALLATLPTARLAGDWRVWVITTFRLIVFPVIAYVVLVPFITDKLLLGTTVLLIAMPVAAYAVLLSEEYHVDATLASQGVFLSTVMSLVTIPVLVFLLF
jgi:malate permease and related proteins